MKPSSEGDWIPRALGSIDPFRMCPFVNEISYEARKLPEFQEFLFPEKKSLCLSAFGIFVVWSPFHSHLENAEDNKSV